MSRIRASRRAAGRAFWPRAVAGLALLLLTACAQPANITAPLPPDPNAAFDPRLFGAWTADWREGDQVIHAALSIAPISANRARVTGDASTLMDVGLHGVTGNAVAAAWVAWASEVGGETYFTADMTAFGEIEFADGRVQPPADPIAPDFMLHGHWIGQAWVAGDDRLHLSFIMTDEIEDVTMLDLMARRTPCRDNCDETLVELAPDELAALIRAERGGALFRSAYVFTRAAADPPLRAR